MGIFQLTLIVATFLCSLVAGFLFAFAVVVMPGIGNLGDGEFLRAFQVMDRVIQNNQPVFLLVWMGSVVALLASAALGFGQLDGTGRLLMIVAVLVFLLGVQLPTAHHQHSVEQHRAVSRDRPHGRDGAGSCSPETSNRVGTPGTRSGRSWRAWSPSCSSSCYSDSEGNAIWVLPTQIHYGVAIFNALFSGTCRSGSVQSGSFDPGVVC